MLSGYKIGTTFLFTMNGDEISGTNYLLQFIFYKIVNF